MRADPPSVALFARLPLGTAVGEFDLYGFQDQRGDALLALVRGRVEGRHRVLTRLHSECLTGDALGSLRCDCGVQLRMSLRAIAAEEHGLLLYLAGQEGRGIGLANKLRAYVLQHEGADTVDANLQLGLPVDARDYGPSALVLEELGIRSVRLLTNNPAKVRALRAHGIRVEDAVPIHATVHARNLGYLLTKRRRIGHEAPPALVPLEPDGVGHDLPVDVSLRDVRRSFLRGRASHTSTAAAVAAASPRDHGLRRGRLLHPLRASVQVHVS